MFFIIIAVLASAVCLYNAYIVAKRYLDAWKDMHS